MDRRQFCDTVTRQLRCRWEAPTVRQELYDHIQDHMDALISGGMGRDEAEEAAVAAMGDPEALGKALDAVHSPWPWRISLLCARCCKIALVLSVVLTLQNLMTEDLPSPRFLPTATASDAFQNLLRENWEEEIRATGTVTGGGRLGDYTFRPQGEALLVYRPDHTYDDGTVYPGACGSPFWSRPPTSSSGWTTWTSPGTPSPPRTTVAIPTARRTWAPTLNPPAGGSWVIRSSPSTTPTRRLAASPSPWPPPGSGSPLP